MRLRTTPVFKAYQIRAAMSALGQKRTCAVQKDMSALPPKADMCGATEDVRFGPKADIHWPVKLNRESSPGWVLSRSLYRKLEKQICHRPSVLTRSIISTPLAVSHDVVMRLAACNRIADRNRQSGCVCPISVGPAKMLLGSLSAPAAQGFLPTP